MLPKHITSRNRILLILASVVSLFFADERQIGASFGRLWNHDLAAKSENGVYLVEAKWAENVKGPIAASWKNIKYSLTHIPSGKRVWERIRNPGEEQPWPSPDVLIVDDSGVVVIGDIHNAFWVIDIAGKASRVVSLSEYIPKDEYEKWVRQSTAGPMWAGLSLWYFSRVDDDLYFVVRTYWDRRLVINVNSRSPVPDPSRIERQLTAAETRISLKILKEGAANQFSPNSDELIVDSDIRTAAFLAGKLNIREAIPLLKQLEAAANESSSSTFAGADIEYEENLPRQIAQFSLRRLDAVPIGYPASQIEVNGKEPNWKSPWPASGATRSKEADKLQIAWTRLQILDAIGPPDFIYLWHDRDSEEDKDEKDDKDHYVWEYDMDSEKPFTLRLILSDHKLLRAVRTQPMWRTSDRDEYLAH